jgi:hypothetical protein
MGSLKVLSMAGGLWLVDSSKPTSYWRLGYLATGNPAKKFIKYLIL